MPRFAGIRPLLSPVPFLVSIATKTKNYHAGDRRRSNLHPRGNGALLLSRRKEVARFEASNGWSARRQSGSGTLVGCVLSILRAYFPSGGSGLAAASLRFHAVLCWMSKLPLLRS